MAINPNYEHETVMSKLNVNGSIYWLKDADLRALVETFGDAVFKNVAEEIAKGNVNLATSGDVAQAIEDAVKDIEGAMHFRGVVERQEGETDAEALARAIANPKSGDVAIMKDNGKEYIYDGTKWEEVGDQNIYLTKAEAERDYVKKATKVAGIDLQDNITVEEMETALDLKALAHKASASGQVSTIDSGSVTAGKAGEYNVSAQTVTVPKTFGELDVTPAGDVEVTKKTGATVKYDKVGAITVAGATAAEGQTANYTPAGTVTAPTITAGLDLKEASVATVTSAGTAYSITDGSVEQAADSKSAFVKKGYKIEMNSTDAEQLDISVLTAADTTFFGDAVTAAGAVTYNKPVLSGALPTFGSKDVVIKTGSTASAALDSAPQFSGTGAVLSASAATTVEDATVTDAVYEAAFDGDEKKVTPAIATTENASVTQGKVTVASDEFAVEFERTNKTVTVQ